MIYKYDTCLPLTLKPMKTVLLALSFALVTTGCGPIEYGTNGNPCPYLSFGPSSCDKEDSTPSPSVTPSPVPTVYIKGKPTQRAGNKG